MIGAGPVLWPKLCIYSNIMRPLIISLLTAGIGWSVVWSDGRWADTHDFARYAEAEKFFKSLAGKNPNAICFVEGKLV